MTPDERRQLFERRLKLFEEGRQTGMPLNMARAYANEVRPIDSEQARFEAGFDTPLSQPRLYRG